MTLQQVMSPNKICFQKLYKVWRRHENQFHFLATTKNQHRVEEIPFCLKSLDKHNVKCKCSLHSEQPNSCS